MSRRSLMIRLAWERFRARRKPGTAIAASNAMIATTIMISTNVNPAGTRERFLFICSRKANRVPDISTLDIFLPLLKIMSVKLLSRDYEALASFRYAMRKFLRFSKEELAARAALTPEQYEALLAIR